MSYGKHFKNKIQKLLDSWLNPFKLDNKLTDEKMECMQFGICNYVPKKTEEIPYFHF